MIFLGKRLFTSISSKKVNDILRLLQTCNCILNDDFFLQEARFPQLRSLTSEQRTKLKASFVHFDDPSFCEWMRSLKVVPPQPS